MWPPVTKGFWRGSQAAPKRHAMALVRAVQRFESQLFEEMISQVCPFVTTFVWLPKRECPKGRVDPSGNVPVRVLL